jgi:hypothetical protein
MQTLLVLYTTLFQHFPRGPRSLSAYISIQYEAFSICCGRVSICIPGRERVTELTDGSLNRYCPVSLCSMGRRTETPSLIVLYCPLSNGPVLLGVVDSQPAVLFSLSAGDLYYIHRNKKGLCSIPVWKTNLQEKPGQRFEVNFRIL